MTTPAGRIGKARTKEWFQTFPKWDHEDKEKILQLLMPLGIQSAKVALEHHEDGTPHFHAVYSLTLKKTKPQLVKYFKINLPDDYKRCTVLRALEPAKSSKQLTNYISKEDADVITYWQPPNLDHLNDLCSRAGLPDFGTLQVQIRQQRAHERLCSRALAAVHEKELSVSKDFRNLLDFFSGTENLGIMKNEKGVSTVDMFIASCKDVLKYTGM